MSDTFRKVLTILFQKKMIHSLSETHCEEIQPADLSTI